MKMKLLKAWLKIKLRQASTTGGLALGLVWLVKQFGYEIPPEYMPSLENIGMALAAILLIFMRESGETDAIKDAKHQVEVATHETHVPPVTPTQPQPVSVRRQSPVPPVAGPRTPGGNQPPSGGFNG